MKKKLLLGLLTLVSTAACSIGATACGGHKHSYSSDWDNDEYQHWHNCTSGDGAKTTPEDHDWGAPVVKEAATCTTDGEVEYTCQTCGYVKVETITASGHNWSTEWADDNADHHHHACLNDGCTATTDEEEHGGWVDGDIIDEAGCTADGSKYIICEVCGYVSTAVIPATGHVPSDNVTVNKEATCTEDGEVTIVCLVCGESYTEVVPATGHIPGEDYTVTKQPTCTEEGTYTATCETCNEEFTGVIPALGHEWGEWVVVDENASCTDETTRKRVCSVCGEEETRVFPASEHRYGDWNVTVEATCENDGSRTHTCVTCGHVETEVIPATGHHYTDWNVNNPTTEEPGSAIMYCSGDVDGDHPITAVLPALTKENGVYVKGAYDDFDYNEATGVYTFTLNHEQGAITFKVYEINGVSDAVNVALATQSQVISATAVREGILVNSTSMLNAMGGGGTPSGTVSSLNVTFELGYNYAHVNNPAEGNEYFYSLNDDGTLFAVLKRGIGGTLSGDGEEFASSTGTLIEKDKAATLECLNGFGYGFTYMTGGQKFYGTGSIINYLYAVGKMNLNKDFTEGYKTDSNGNTVYYFTYGYLAGKYFDVVYVEFTLDKSYIVDSATLQVKSYALMEYDLPVALDESLVEIKTVDGVEVFYYNGEPANYYKGDNGKYYEFYFDDQGEKHTKVGIIQTYEQLPNGTYRVVSGKEDFWAYSETYTVSQKTQLEAGQTLPVNPYNLDDFLVSSFDLVYNGESFMNGDTIEINANTAANIEIKNVLPTTYNPYFDEFTIILVDDMGREIPASEMLNVADGEVGYYFYNGLDGITISDDYSIYFKSLIAGEWDLKIVTAKNVFNAHLVVNYVAPAELFAEVRQVNDTNGSVSWNRSVNNTEVYEGEALTVRAAVGHPHYEAAGYTVVVTDAEGNNVTSSCLTMQSDDGLPVAVFRSNTTGTYTITLVSTKSNAKTATVTVTVKEAPDVSEMLADNYGNDDYGFAVSLMPETQGALNGTATITKGFGDNTEETIISFSYDAATRSFTCEYVSGAHGTYVQGVDIDYNYGLELSESYKLYLTYDSEFDGSRVKVLIGGLTNSLVCINATAAKAQSAADKLTANVSGIYKITATTYTFVAVNGVQYDAQPDEEYLQYIGTDGVELTLYIGDYIQIWNGMGSNPKYTIELVEAFRNVAVEGIEFAEETATLRAGASMTILPGYTPANTTQKGLLWSTSNASIATVDANGIITGVSAGKVIITATTSNGRYSTSIELTVIAENALLIGENELVSVGPFWDKDFVFNGEAGKTYLVEVIHGLSYANGAVKFNGDATSFSYNGSTAASVTVKADNDGVITVCLSQYGYGTVSVYVTINEYVEPDGPEYVDISEGTTTFDISVGQEYSYKLTGEANTQYTIAASFTSKWLIVDGEKDVESFTSKELTVTTDENGYAYFMTQTYDPTVTITVTKVDSTEPDQPEQPEQPEDPVPSSYTIEVDTNLIIPSLGANGATINFGDSVEGSVTYKIFAYLNGDPCDDVTFQVGINQGSTLEFEVSKMNSYVTVKSNNGTLSNVMIVLTEANPDAGSSDGELHLGVTYTTRESDEVSGAYSYTFTAEEEDDYTIIIFDTYEYGVGTYEINGEETENGGVTVTETVHLSAGAQLSIVVYYDGLAITVYKASDVVEGADDLVLGETYTTTEDDCGKELVLTVEEEGDYTVTLYDTYEDGVGTYSINGEETENGDVTVTETVHLSAGDKLAIVVWLDGITITVTKA